MRIKIDGFIMTLIVLVLLLMIMELTGCSSTTKTTEIKEEIITVDVPVIRDTLLVEWNSLPDTLMHAWEEFVEQIPDSANISGTTETKHKDGRVTKVKATYYPKRDTLIVEAEQSKLEITDLDVTEIYQEKDVPLSQKLGYGVIVLVIVAAGFFIIKKTVKF